MLLWIGEVGITFYLNTASKWRTVAAKYLNRIKIIEAAKIAPNGLLQLKTVDLVIIWLGCKAVNHLHQTMWKYKWNRRYFSWFLLIKYYIILFHSFPLCSFHYISFHSTLTKIPHARFCMWKCFTRKQKRGHVTHVLITYTIH